MGEWKRLGERIHEEAKSEGPEAEAELAAIERHFSLGAQLLQLRLQQHMTQTDVAESSGVPQSEISRIERGSANPTFKTIDAIASALEATIALLPRNEASTARTRPLARVREREEAR